MGAAEICHSDLSVINGTRVWPLPIVLGHEAWGRGRGIGACVDLLAGDHVVFSFLPACGVCPMCATGRASWYEPQSSVVARESVVKIDADIPIETAVRWHRCC